MGTAGHAPAVTTDPRTTTRKRVITVQVSEYRVTMAHDGGTVKITVTASNASAAVDMVISAEGAPRRSARLVETRPLAFERIDNDTWRPVPGDQWGRVDDQPANVDAHTNPFAPDPRNPYRKFADVELRGHHNAVAYCVEHPETYADGTRLEESRARLEEITEELSRREDVTRAVELWERLCEVPFVRGETQGYYTHSTRHLSPETVDHHYGNVYRMPDAVEIEALVLSDGEETAYPPHDAQPEYDPSIPDLTPEQRAAVYYHEDKNPWSSDDRLYPITLTLITCGDYHGSDVDAANNRALQGTPGVEVREPNTSGMSSVFNVSTTVVGEMSSFTNNQTTADWERDPAQQRADALEWLESLVKQMEGLATDYPLIDDEEHSKLVDELAEEAWDAWLESNVHSELIKMGPGGSDAWEDSFDDMGPELQATIREAYYAFEGNDWVVESLGSGAVNGAHTDAVKHVARTVFGWNVP